MPACLRAGRCRGDRGDAGRAIRAAGGLGDVQMTERRIERESLEYIDCEVPQDMTLREWRCEKPTEPARPKRIRAGRPKRRRAAAAAVGRATRLRRRVG